MENVGEGCVYEGKEGNVFMKLDKTTGNVLFNGTLNTFYLRLYGVRHMVKDLSDSEKGNLLLPHGLLFPINSKGSFIYASSHRECEVEEVGISNNGGWRR